MAHGRFPTTLAGGVILCGDGLKRVNSKGGIQTILKSFILIPMLICLKLDKWHLEI